MCPLRTAKGGPEEAHTDVSDDEDDTYDVTQSLRDFVGSAHSTSTLVLGKSTDAGAS